MARRSTSFLSTNVPSARRWRDGTPFAFVVAADCRLNGLGYLSKWESKSIVSVGDGFLANFSESFGCPRDGSANGVRTGSRDTIPSYWVEVENGVRRTHGVPRARITRSSLNDQRPSAVAVKSEISELQVAFSSFGRLRLGARSRRTPSRTRRIPHRSRDNLLLKIVVPVRSFLRH